MVLSASYVDENASTSFVLSSVSPRCAASPVYTHISHFSFCFNIPTIETMGSSLITSKVASWTVVSFQHSKQRLVWVKGPSLLWTQNLVPDTNRFAIKKKSINGKKYPTTWTNKSMKVILKRVSTSVPGLLFVTCWKEAIIFFFWNLPTLFLNLGLEISLDQLTHFCNYLFCSSDINRKVASNILISILSHSYRTWFT